MLRDQRGFTLIELMIVMVVIGILATVAQPLFRNMSDRARVARVRANMNVIQMTVEDFSTRNDGIYPATAATTTAVGGKTLAALFPGGTIPVNPFTQASTSLDWSNASGTVPSTDPAGGIALNTIQTIVGGVHDAYEVIGADETGVQLSMVLSNN